MLMKLAGQNPGDRINKRSGDTSLALSALRVGVSHANASFRASCPVELTPSSAPAFGLRQRSAASATSTRGVHCCCHARKYGLLQRGSSARPIGRCSKASGLGFLSTNRLTDAWRVCLAWGHAASSAGAERPPFDVLAAFTSAWDYCLQHLQIKRSRVTRLRLSTYPHR